MYYNGSDVWMQQDKKKYKFDQSPIIYSFVVSPRKHDNIIKTAIILSTDVVDAW